MSLASSRDCLAGKHFLFGWVGEGGGEILQLQGFGQE